MFRGRFEDMFVSLSGERFRCDDCAGHWQVQVCLRSGREWGVADMELVGFGRPLCGMIPARGVWQTGREGYSYTSWLVAWDTVLSGRDRAGEGSGVY